MMRGRRHALLIAGVFALGAALNLAVGPAPRQTQAQQVVDAPWELPAPRRPDIEVLDAEWARHAPWGSAPKPPEVAPPPPPPPPAPVGIVRGQKGRQEAIFLVAGEGTVRVAPGESLPGGGRLLRVAGMRVSWVDADGVEKEREMFIDPPPTLPTGRAASMPPLSNMVPGTPAAESVPAGRASRRGRREAASPRPDVQPPPQPPAGQAVVPASGSEGRGVDGAAGGNVTTVSARSLRNGGAAERRPAPPAADSATPAPRPRGREGNR